MTHFFRKVSAGSRIYFVDARVDSKDQPYMTITEISKASNTRSTVYLHKEDFDKFYDAVCDVMDFIEGKTSANVNAEK